MANSDSTTKISHDVIVMIADAIARCDFRTAISQCTTGKLGPWHISVGENGWVRHLRVKTADVDGANATLEMLDHKPGVSVINLDELSSGETFTFFTLSELISGGYLGVKQILCPAVAMAA